MGGGGHQMPEIPKYTRYKWEDIPQLVKHQERLAEHGLRDPWARNHAWKYMMPATKNRQLPWYMLWSVNYPAQRGFVFGLIALGIYIGTDKLTGGKLTGGSGHH